MKTIDVEDTKVHVTRGVTTIVAKKHVLTHNLHPPKKKNQH